MISVWLNIHMTVHIRVLCWLYDDLSLVKHLPDCSPWGHDDLWLNIHLIVHHECADCTMTSVWLNSHMIVHHGVLYWLHDDLSLIKHSHDCNLPRLITAVISRHQWTRVTASLSSTPQWPPTTHCKDLFVRTTWRPLFGFFAQNINCFGLTGWITGLTGGLYSVLLLIVFI